MERATREARGARSCSRPVTVLYNELDPYAAAWLRNLISAGLIAPGDVAECSLKDLRPDDLRRYTQVHLYAGVGVWPYSPRRAGWPDDRPCWTFSEPCQPFSAAGRRSGTADERYLRPFTHHLVRECRPPVCFGEQVASKDGLGWLDTLQADMEGEGYAFGAVDTCSAGSGAPHIRQRLRFVAQRLAYPGLPELSGRDGAASDNDRCSDTRVVKGFQPAPRSAADRLADAESVGHEGKPLRAGPELPKDGTTEDGITSRLADANSWQLAGQPIVRGTERDGKDAGRTQGSGEFGPCLDDGRLANTTPSGRGEERPNIGGEPIGDGTQGHAARSGNGSSDHRPGPINGFWRDADWLFCRDEKWRPVEPGTFPLAHGAASRVGRLRAYGNAVDAEATRHFIEAAAGALGLRLNATSALTTDVSQPDLKGVFA
ncbi:MULTISPECIES: DNA cytosine methyltransferase [unclassified Aurantimonas]|uniref:DNA cytosine methyltransferase n=1 Tax=unclassified Aurantimonas TaxID=2638230 RepID=UPI002E1858B2|nr:MULTISPECIES: DNA cytosine methyltransferase [unclassified Aurantimonas]MEC5291565.1 DNA cytosine methyltransferase [Aurantimonas sp. C2-3-R2]MEC5412649.1 DNA cytosine methyltransferase [Aurantimonas sp. C2-4-R8]